MGWGLKLFILNKGVVTTPPKAKPNAKQLVD
jgi:hypothetical protein